MASISNRIEVLVDVVTDKAREEFKSLKSSLSEAEGAAGKFKTATSGGLDFVKEHAGAMAIGAGGAIATFAVEAVGAFTKTAKTAVDTGKIIGTSTEDASRWVAVGQEFGVSAEQIQTGAGKISKTLDKAVWEKYGIATRDAGGNIRDTNDLLIEALSTISKLPTAAERSKAGTDLLGKGYANLAPLVGHTREEYEKMLSSVGEGEVITDGEAKKAEAMRQAQVKLKKALEEVTLAAGGLVAESAPMISFFASAVDWATKLHDKLDELPGPLKAIADVVTKNPITAFKDAVVAATSEVDTNKMSLEDMMKVLDETGGSAKHNAAIIDQWYEAHHQLNPAIAETSREAKHLSDNSLELADRMDVVAQSAGDTERETRRLKGAMGDASAAIDYLNTQYTNLTSLLDEKKAWDNAKQAVEDWKQKVKEGKTDIGDLGKQLTDVQITLTGYTNDLKDVPDFVKSEIYTEIQAGDVEHAEAILDILARDRHVSYFADVVNSPIAPPVGGGRQRRAAGGPTWPGQPFEVAEGGKPEMYTEGGRSYLLPGANGQVTPFAAAGGAGGGSINVTINMPPGSSGDDVVRAIKKFEARNGPGWRS